MSGEGEGRPGMGAGDRATLRYYRLRRWHDLADRPADDTDALLRKARAAFLLRARLAVSEARREIPEILKNEYRRNVACDLDAARRMHRLILARRQRRGVMNLDSVRWKRFRDLATPREAAAAMLELYGARADAAAAQAAAAALADNRDEDVFYWVEAWAVLRPGPRPPAPPVPAWRH